MVFTITDDARHQILGMIENETEPVHLRFGVKGGGCSGLSYSLGFEDDSDINAELDTVEIINDIPVVIFKQDIPMIENTVIDFKQNLMGGGFSIENPNALMSCGCGSSFRAKDNEGTPEKC